MPNRGVKLLPNQASVRAHINGRTQVVNTEVQERAGHALLPRSSVRISKQPVWAFPNKKKRP